MEEVDEELHRKSRSSVSQSDACSGAELVDFSIRQCVRGTEDVAAEVAAVALHGILFHSAFPTQQCMKRFELLESLLRVHLCVQSVALNQEGVSTQRDVDAEFSCDAAQQRRKPPAFARVRQQKHHIVRVDQVAQPTHLLLHTAFHLLLLHHSLHHVVGHRNLEHHSVAVDRRIDRLQLLRRGPQT